MKILIDNGHGRETAGKRSPDGRLLEWAYNREIARRVVDALTSLGLDAELLVPESEDISLAERCRRVNRVCSELGRRNVCLVSIHVNAAGRGNKWYNATGWCCYTSKGQTEGDKLANCLCAACLTESGFMDCYHKRRIIKSSPNVAIENQSVRRLSF